MFKNQNKLMNNMNNNNKLLLNNKLSFLLT